MLNKNKDKRKTEDSKDQQILKINLNLEDLAQKMKRNKWKKMMAKDLEIKPLKFLNFRDLNLKIHLLIMRTRISIYLRISNNTHKINR